MLTVACVLRDGGEYHAGHVQALAERVDRHLTLPHRFVCLTDTLVTGIDVVMLEHDWPGWWAKIELFRPGLFDGPVLYLDLDTIPVRNMDEIAVGHTFTVLRNFWVEPGHERIGSGLMAWNTDLSAIYEAFRRDPSVRDQYVEKQAWGDQGFVQQWAWKADRWQVKHPGKVVSYKMHCGEGIPQGAAVVCFHGQPRPWATRLWRL